MAYFAHIGGFAFGLAGDQAARDEAQADAAGRSRCTDRACALVVFTIALLFIAALGVLTVLDIADHGVTALGVLAILVLVLFMIGIVGALGIPRGTMSGVLQEGRARRRAAGEPEADAGGRAGASLRDTVAASP